MGGEPMNLTETYTETAQNLSRGLSKIDLYQKDREREIPEIQYKDIRIIFRKMYSLPVAYIDGSNDSDAAIGENLCFHYPVFIPGRTGMGTGDKRLSKRFSRMTILLHGLNERRWDKYLPWAAALCRLTNSPVIMIPVAYHLNRAPGVWSDIRTMMPISKKRKGDDSENPTASFVNAALSQRLEERPERFLSGGMQTISDVERVIRLIRSDQDALFTPDAEIHFFSYSIGSTLTEALLMIDAEREQQQQMLSRSRACLFCGGSLLEYANPVSRAILDDRAAGRLNQFFDSLVKKACPSRFPIPIPIPEKDNPVNTEKTLPGIFASLLRSSFAAEYRQRLFQKISSRIMGITLDIDTVFPGRGLHETWKDPEGKELISITEFTGPPQSSHVVPFPIGTDAEEQRESDQAFSQIFVHAAEFLRVI
jgi:hypothetical protein